MKILWLTPIFPYPLYSGGQVRAYNLIKNLSHNHQIALFSFIRPERKQGPIKEVKKFCFKIRTFTGRKIWSLRNFLLAGSTHLPFTISHFYGDSLVRDSLEKELEKERYDLVHFESFYTSPYLNCAFSLPTVMGNENIEYLIYQRFIAQKRLAPLRWFLSFDVWKMRKYEENVWKKADLNLAVSKVDAEKIEKVTGKKCTVVPNGVDLEFFQYKQKIIAHNKEPILLFVGDFKYFPNQDAVNFLLKKIWPKIKTKVSKAKLWLIGKTPISFIKNLESMDVKVDDGVDNIRQAYYSADILVAPMRIASGTNIKVLEAMATGTPVVTTSIGIEGIKARDEKEVIVRDKPEELAEAVVKLIKDKDHYRKLGEASRQLVERFYDWSKIIKKLEEAYQELVYGKKA